MTVLQALILGIVEGVTEFLPISSTAHLMFTSSVLGLAQNDFVKTFEIAIQSGAILAVVALYWRKFLDVTTCIRVAVAFIPTAVIGLLLYSFIKSHLIGNIPLALIALGLGGVALILFERFVTTHHAPNAQQETLSYTQALLVGCAQSVAMIPGVSRSAATIVGGLLLGISRTTIVEFSFLLAVPTMAAATGLDLLKHAGGFASADLLSLVVGFIVSFIVALISIRWLIRYVRTHDFTSFGIYRIVAAFLFALLLFY